MRIGLGIGIGFASARPFYATDLDGCVLWLPEPLAANVVAAGGAVSQWSDLSGLGHHAIQAAAGQRPTLQATGGPFGGPCVQGDGTADRLVANWSQTQPTTTFIVHSGAAPADNETVLDGGGGVVNTLRTYGVGGSWRLFTGGGGLDKPWSAGWHVRTLIANGASSEHRVDGGAAAAGNVGVADSNGVCLFSAGDDRFYCNDSVVEVIQYSRVLTTAERQNVERCLGARWGLAVA